MSEHEAHADSQEAKLMQYVDFTRAFTLRYVTGSVDAFRHYGVDCIASINDVQLNRIYVNAVPRDLEYYVVKIIAKAPSTWHGLLTHCVFNPDIDVAQLRIKGKGMLNLFRRSRLPITVIKWLQRDAPVSLDFRLRRSAPIILPNDQGVIDELLMNDVYYEMHVTIVQQSLLLHVVEVLLFNTMLFEKALNMLAPQVTKA